jgi:hypothetical protein
MRRGHMLCGKRGHGGLGNCACLPSTINLTHTLALAHFIVTNLTPPLPSPPQNRTQLRRADAAVLAAWEGLDQAEDFRRAYSRAMAISLLLCDVTGSGGAGLGGDSRVGMFVGVGGCVKTSFHVVVSVRPIVR